MAKTQSVEVGNFDALHQALEPYKSASGSWLFRGHGSVDWDLVPKAGRIEWKRDDLSVLQSWRKRALEYASLIPRTDWEWAAVAQHHGLATRLLDWTLSPLTATFFAVSEAASSDAVVFAFRPRHTIDTERMKLKTFSGIYHYRPEGIAQRICRQAAVFTVHGPPSLALTAKAGVGQLDQIIIKASCKERLLQELDFYGVNRVNLFPDLDGLSAYLNWYYGGSFAAKSGTWGK